MDRDRWVLAHRGPRAPSRPDQPAGFHLELERSASAEIVPVATVFLTNRECPWRCVMCDLWKHTLAGGVQPGDIPAQIDKALARLAAGLAADPSRPATPPARQIKLYNSGSFFDPRAVPPEDYRAIAERVARFERVIVEGHPALIGDRVLRFRDQLAAVAGRSDSAHRGRPLLEVAMGLETAHPEVLAKLNKRMTPAQFARACRFLRNHQIAIRSFLLVQPPFLDPALALEWTRRSLEFAFDSGVDVAVLIPTRLGNGALELLARQGHFTPPRLAALEAAADLGIGLRHGRVFADLWDLKAFADCAACFPARLARLEHLNHHQQSLPPIECPDCGRPKRGSAA